MLPWEVRYYLLQWENILIILGGYLILSKENERAGMIILTLGLFFVFDDWFRVSFWELWPLVFVFVGIYIIRQRAVGGDEISLEDNDSYVEDTAISEAEIEYFLRQTSKKETSLPSLVGQT